METIEDILNNLPPEPTGILDIVVDVPEIKSSSYTYDGGGKEYDHDNFPPISGFSGALWGHAPAKEYTPEELLEALNKVTK